MGSPMTADLLLRLLRAPAMAAALSPDEWDLALRQARAAALTGRLAVRLREAKALDAVPPAVRRHLDAALQVASRLRQALEWEFQCLGRLLAPLEVPVVLLKGAAYGAAGLPVAEGRLFGDIDLLVPRPRLREVEGALLAHGWAPMKLDPYDQRYYRRWMHEIPPLEHVRRQTVVDVHHTLLPLTARHHPDPALIFAASRASPWAGFRLPSPADLVVHCATHLFHEGETDRALRDLMDFDGLLRHFAAVEPGFYAGLVPRARLLDLARPLFYALRYAQRLLGTPIPEAVMQAAQQAAPPLPLRLAMDGLAAEIFRPKHASCRGPFTALAHFALYVRGHWLRMPLHLLLPHLLRKALARRQPPAARRDRPP